MSQVVDVAIVGAGPAGTTLAAALASRGIEVLVLERAPAWQWRAGGVFTSPAAMRALERVGLEHEVLDAIARPIPAMRLETPGGAVARLTYGADARGALGGRVRPVAARPGARGARARSRRDDPQGSASQCRQARPGRRRRRWASREDSIRARIVVGADGSGSIVARAAGVARSARLPPRIGLTWHVVDPRPAADAAGAALDARLAVIRDGYVGLAPVPGGRLNIGIVLGPSWRDGLARDGAAVTTRRALAMVPTTADDPIPWAEAISVRADRGRGPAGRSRDTARRPRLVPRG